MTKDDITMIMLNVLSYSKLIITTIQISLYFFKMSFSFSQIKKKSTNTKMFQSLKYFICSSHTFLVLIKHLHSNSDSLRKHLWHSFSYLVFSKGIFGNILTLRSMLILILPDYNKNNDLLQYNL